MKKTKIYLRNTRHSLTFLLAHLWLQWVRDLSHMVSVEASTPKLCPQGTGDMPVIIFQGPSATRVVEHGLITYRCHCDSNCCYHGYQSPKSISSILVVNYNQLTSQHWTEHHQPTVNQLWTIVQLSTIKNHRFTMIYPSFANDWPMLPIHLTNPLRQIPPDSPV